MTHDDHRNDGLGWDDGLGWLGSRGRDGGIDTVPLPGVPGGLSLCGKHAIGPDVHAAARRCGASTVVCLVEEHELVDRYPEYLAWLHEARRTPALGPGGREVDVVWLPVHDLHAPPLSVALHLVTNLVERVRAGEHLLVHCGAGIGRAGTVAVCMLVLLGMGETEALEHVARHRPMAGPEVGAQRNLVTAVAQAAGRCDR